MVNHKLEAFAKYMRMRFERSAEFDRCYRPSLKRDVNKYMEIAMKHRVCGATGELMFDSLASMQEWETFCAGWDSALNL